MEVLEIFSAVILQKNVQYFPNISSQPASHIIQECLS